MNVLGTRLDPEWRLRRARAAIGARVGLLLLALAAAIGPGARPADAGEPARRAEAGAAAWTWTADMIALAARIPVQDAGRVKPLQTYAGYTLLGLDHRRSSADADGRDLSSLAWLLEVLFRPERARRAPCFLVETDEVLDAIRLEHGRRKKRDRYAYDDLAPGRARLSELAAGYLRVESNRRSAVEDGIVALDHAVVVFERLSTLLAFARTELDLGDAPAVRALFPGDGRAGVLEVLARSEDLARLEGPADPHAAIRRAGRRSRPARPPRGAGAAARAPCARERRVRARADPAAELDGAGPPVVRARAHAPRGRRAPGSSRGLGGAPRAAVRDAGGGRPGRRGRVHRRVARVPGVLGGDGARPGRVRQDRARGGARRPRSVPSRRPSLSVRLRHRRARLARVQPVAATRRVGGPPRRARAPGGGHRHSLRPARAPADQHALRDRALHLGPRGGGLPRGRTDRPPRRRARARPGARLARPLRGEQVRGAEGGGHPAAARGGARHEFLARDARHLHRDRVLGRTHRLGDRPRHRARARVRPAPRRRGVPPRGHPHDLRHALLRPALQRRRDDPRRHLGERVVGTVLGLGSEGKRRIDDLPSSSSRSCTRGWAAT